MYVVPKQYTWHLKSLTLIDILAMLISIRAILSLGTTDVYFGKLSKKGSLAKDNEQTAHIYIYIKGEQFDHVLTRICDPQVNWAYLFPFDFWEQLVTIIHLDIQQLISILLPKNL